MTKEMRPSHRIDVLTDALTYYAQKTISNIGWFQYTSLAYRMQLHHNCTDSILVKRIQRAQKVEGESSMKLQELMTSYPGIV